MHARSRANTGSTIDIIALKRSWTVIAEKISISRRIQPVPHHGLPPQTERLLRPSRWPQLLLKEEWKQFAESAGNPPAAAEIGRNQIGNLDSATHEFLRRRRERRIHGISDTNFRIVLKGPLGLVSEVGEQPKTDRT